MWHPTMYYCSECDKKYTTYQGMWNHKQKKHGDKKSVSHLCKFCDRTYTTVGNLNKHIKICKKNPKNKETENEKQNNFMDKDQFMMEMLKSQSGQMQQLMNLVSQCMIQSQSNNLAVQPNQQALVPSIDNDDGVSLAGNHNTNNNNNNNNTNTQNINTNSNNTNNTNTQNININMVPLGQENLSEVLSTHEQVKILKQKNECLETIIRYVHFNNKFPQFQNIAIENHTDTIGRKYDDDSKNFIAVPKDEMILDLIENRMNDIYDFLVENKANISNKTFKVVENLGNKFSNQGYIDAQKDKIGFLVCGCTSEIKKRKLILKNR